jgi:hypothetical protein
MRSSLIKGGYHNAGPGPLATSFAIPLILSAIGCFAPDRAEARTYGGY